MSIQREAYEAAQGLPVTSKPYRISVLADNLAYEILTQFKDAGLRMGNADPIEELVTAIFIKGCEENQVEWRGFV